ncbi:MAG: hypothetical protein AAFN44_20800, partial [Pseudomonadota bacterium]
MGEIGDRWRILFGLSARSAYAQAAERVMDAVRDLDRALPQTSRTLGEAEEDAQTVPRDRRTPRQAPP